MPCPVPLSLTLSVLIGGVVLPGQHDRLQPERPRIGLVLSGGGARGAAHVGVIRVLEELRIPIHAIAGNSMGALVGGSYAYGLSPDEMEHILTSLDWPLMLSDAPRRSMIPFRRKQDDLNLLFDLTLGFRDWQLVLPRGLVQGHYTRNTLKLMTSEALGPMNFDELPIPFRAVAADIGTGEEVVLGSGRLADAMAASMSIPGVFSPVEINGRSLVDGMVVNNIPIDVCKAMGVDVVIAVDIGTPILEAGQIKTLLDVTGQMVSILMQKNVDARLDQLTVDDALVRPDLGDMSSTDFGATAKAIAIGAEAARAAAPKLRRFSVSEAEYAEFLARHRRPAAAAPTIRGIEIVNDSGLGEAVIRTRMRTAAGQALDLRKLEADLDRIHGLEAFERVTFEIEPAAAGAIDLRIICIERSWGPNYIRFGLSIQDNFKGDSTYRFGVNYTVRNLNRYGGELRTDVQVGQEIAFGTEFYQPLDPANRFFIAPRGRWADLPVNVYQGGAKVAEADVEFGQIGLDIGANLRDWAELRLGVRRTRGDVDFTLTSTSLMSSSFDDAAFRVGLEIDTLDEAGFPTSGVRAGLEYLNSDTDLGADAEYQRLQIGGAQAFSWDPATLIVVGQYASALDGTTLPTYQSISAGGLFNLSGLQSGELSGQHSVFAAAIGFVQISGARRKLLGLPTYLGATIEAGSVTATRSALFDNPILAGSVWIGSDTPAGPVYLAYGHAEGGDGSVYLFVGRSF